jgi:GT2 family glycosyltransferase
MIALCATTGARQPQGLEHAGVSSLLTDSRPGWAAAANALLDLAASRGDDALFLDDDIELTADSLRFLWWPLIDAADVFGFTLFTNGTVTSAGFHATADGGLRPQQMLVDIMRPSLVAHVTASCLYIKREVLQAGIRFPVWPGQHHEDVAFTYDCWLRGFRVAYVPGVVHHHMNMAVGVGATKSLLPTFQQDRAINAECLRRWIAEHGVPQAIAAGQIPTGFRGL